MTDLEEAGGATAAEHIETAALQAAVARSTAAGGGVTAAAPRADAESKLESRLPSLPVVAHATVETVSFSSMQPQEKDKNTHVPRMETAPGFPSSQQPLDVEKDNMVHGSHGCLETEILTAKNQGLGCSMHGESQGDSSLRGIHGGEHGCPFQGEGQGVHEPDKDKHVHGTPCCMKRTNCKVPRMMQGDSQSEHISLSKAASLASVETGAVSSQQPLDYLQEKDKNLNGKSQRKHVHWEGQVETKVW